MSNSGNQKSVVLGAVVIGALAGNVGAQAASNDYAGLLALFQDWRTFERPSCAPARPITPPRRLARKHTELATYQAR